MLFFFCLLSSVFVCGGVRQEDATSRLVLDSVGGLPPPPHTHRLERKEKEKQHSRQQKSLLTSKIRKQNKEKIMNPLRDRNVENYRILPVMNRSILMYYMKSIACIRLQN